MSPRIVGRLESWGYAASKPKLIVLAALFGVVLFGLSCGLDVAWAAFNGVTIVAMVSADALVAVVSAFLLLRVILASRARHRRFLRQLEIVGEMNHHIRNALVALQLSFYSKQDRERLSAVESATDRISWALREILPKSAEGAQDEE